MAAGLVLADRTVIIPRVLQSGETILREAIGLARLFSWMACSYELQLSISEKVA